MLLKFVFYLEMVEGQQFFIYYSDFYRKVTLKVSILTPQVRQWYRGWKGGSHNFDLVTKKIESSTLVTIFFNGKFY